MLPLWGAGMLVMFITGLGAVEYEERWIWWERERGRERNRGVGRVKSGIVGMWEGWDCGVL
jgi:hypothetical protein